MQIYGRMINVAEIPSTRITDEKPLLQQFNQFIIAALRISEEHDALIRDALNRYIVSEKTRWALTQSDVYIKKFPNSKADIRIETRIISLQGIFVTRLFQVMDGQGQQVYMEFYMQFVAINLETRKVERIDLSEIKQLELADGWQRHPFPRLGIEATDQWTTTNHLEVTTAHLDHLQHVNNIVYLDWSMDGVRASDVQDKQLKQVSIRYGRELLLNHQVTVENYAQTNDYQELITKHRIQNATTDQESCFVRLIWQSIEGDI